MNLPKKAYIKELGPREGFQTLSTVYSTSEKLKLIEALTQTGVPEIEVTAFVKKDLVPQMADAEAVVTGLSKNSNCKFSALYLNQKGFLRSIACKELFTEAYIYTAVSDTFLKKNSNTSKQQIIANIPEWLNLFKGHNLEFNCLNISTAFGCYYEGEVEASKVISVIKDFALGLENHATKIKAITLADTVGMATPEKVKKLIELIYKNFSEIEIRLHLHDTRGQALACAAAGLELGVSYFESSLAGMGGCPFTKGAAGNICSEDLINLLHDKGVETGIDLNSYSQAAKIMATIVK